MHRDKLITAPLGNSVLPGITRDSVLQIARDLNIPIVEQMIPREMLYIADEAFFTGTAAEVTPNPIGRQNHSRQRRNGPDHQSASERVLRYRAWRKIRPPRLAHASARAAANSLSAYNSSYASAKGRNQRPFNRFEPAEHKSDRTTSPQQMHS